MSDKAPGCFGSVIAYDKSDAICGACAYACQCEEASYQTMQRLRETIDIEKHIADRNKERIKDNKPVVVVEMKMDETEVVVTKPRGESTLTEDQMEIVNKIGRKKPMERAVNLFKRGIDGKYIKSAIKSGVNPFVAEPPRFLAVACGLLMNEGKFTRADLAEALQKDQVARMSRQTAYSHVAITVALLPALGVIDEVDGAFVLSGAH